MNTNKKNVVRSLLEIRADFHPDTFGKRVSWEIKKTSTLKHGAPNWTIDIYEGQDHITTSYNYEVIAMIAVTAMVSHYLTADKKDGESVIKFHLY